MDSILSYLRTHGYFRQLDIAQLQAVARLATQRTLGRGEILALEGDPCTAVYFVIEGRMDAIKSSLQGREQVVEELGSGQAFYIVPALDGGPLPITTRAAEQTMLLAFPRSDLLALLDAYPSVARAVLLEFARRLRRFTVLIEDLALRKVPQRLARLLLERAASENAYPMTRQQMASRLGTVREVVVRAISQFEREGWIQVRRHVIEIVYPQALRDMAEL